MQCKVLLFLERRRKRTKLPYLLCLLLLISLSIFPLNYALSASSPKTSFTPTPTELRGVWLTNVASGVLFAPWGINRSLKMLSDLNFNTVYPVVWNRGYTFYPSAIARGVTKVDRDPQLKWFRGKSDLLAEIVRIGKQKKLRVIPWFEYGFIVPANSELALLHPNWLTQASNGNKILLENKQEELGTSLPSKKSNTLVQWRKSFQTQLEIKQFWLNPFHPEVQQFIKELIVEIIANYDVDGIQLDDHFGLPVELGYDPYTTSVYRREHNGNNPPNNPRDPEWMSWRADKLTEFMAQIDRSVKIVKPKIKIVLSPNSYNFAYQNYLQDWQTWVKRGLIDELVLQVYQDDWQSFIAELAQPAVRSARKRIPVSVGIFTGTPSRPIEIDRIEQKVKVVRDRGFDGVSFFYWESLWGYIAPESPKQRRKVFQTIFASN